jgi:uncharacterized membrane protein YfcA
MPVLDAVLLFIAGFVAGAVNAVAGGGTFVTFGALSLVGIPPIVANATSSITQFPGYVTSTPAYREDIRLIGRGALTVMMLATLGLTQGGGYHRLNALKNPLAMVIAAVAIVVFVWGGVVAWLQAMVMIPAAALGGYAGIWAARRVPDNLVRGFVVAVGILLAAYYFATD